LQNNVQWQEKHPSRCANTQGQSTYFTDKRLTMSNLAQFAFGNNQVRVVLIDGQPWFVAADLAKILEYANTGKMLQIVDKEDSVEINPQKLDNAKMVLSFNSNTFRVSLINESGLYSVIFNSTKSEAKTFKRWVTSDVLPQIRKTGKYEPQSTLNIYARRVQIASKWEIPKGHWCVFHEISLLANKVGETYHVGEFDLIDGSVGQCWSKYRKAFDWIQPTILFPIFFGDSRDAAHVQVHGYKNSELPHFRDWLENIYTLERLPKYLTGKYGQLMKRD
jgi:prophage antirepressor-like protein